MMTRFISRHDEIYRILSQENGGAWLISHTAPGAPVWISDNDMDAFQRVPTPDTFGAKEPVTAAQSERLRLIQPLLDEEACITDKSQRLAMAKEIASENETTSRRLLRLYYRYLATGRLTDAKGREPQNKADYDWAIRTFYYSAKRLSLRAAYEMMLVQRYTDADGKLMEKAPTWSSFQHYFYSRDYHKQPRKVIAREGLTYYQRNERPAFGSASQWRSKPGAFQMDATQADIYLVSRFDRSTVIGRPYIYLAVDTATQLITGVYVGLEAGESAVMECLANAAADKVPYCKEYGIDITAEQWPCKGLPNEIITDKGREFLGGRMEELCRRYGIEIQSLPPFRPDGKGLVEKAFDLIQQRYKPLLRGKGVIEPDAQERWATDYRAQAVLDIQEFTQVVIHCVLCQNSGRVLSSGLTPAQQWLHADARLSAPPAEEVHLMALPRMTAKLGRKGFHVNALQYVPDRIEGLYLGDTYTLAYDPSDLSHIYMVLEEGYRPCSLAAGSVKYGGLSALEMRAIQKQVSHAKRTARQQELECNTAAIRGIREVVHQAQEKGGMPEKKQSGVIIQEGRNAERRRLT